MREIRSCARTGVRGYAVGHIFKVNGNDEIGERQQVKSDDVGIDERTGGDGNRWLIAEGERFVGVWLDGTSASGFCDKRSGDGQRSFAELVGETYTNGCSADGDVNDLAQRGVGKIRSCRRDGRVRELRRAGPGSHPVFRGRRSGAEDLRWQGEQGK